MKIYLAGQFENDNDWRYDIVRGLKGNSPFTTYGLNWQCWGHLPNAVFGCLDYVGPFESYPDGFSADLHKVAIEKADFVFAWKPAVTDEFDIFTSVELAFAGGANRIVGTGETESYEGRALWFSESISSFCSRPFIGDSPANALKDFIKEASKSINIGQRLNFVNSNKVAQGLFGDDLQRAGYVYLIKADTGHYKIGRSKNIPERMKLFAVKLPFDFEIVHIFPCEDMYRAERELHLIHAKDRTNGEWFALGNKDVEILKSVHRFEQGNFMLSDGYGMPELWERLPGDYRNDPF